MPRSPTPPDPLSAANQAAHNRFIDALEATLVALTELDLDAAGRAWQTLGEAIARHQDVEEELLRAAIPHDHEPAPRGGGRALVEAEHVRLGELSQQAGDAIDALRQAPPEARRLAMVRRLDEVLRVRHLLEHHGQREDEIVYPHLARILPAELAEGFATRL